MSVLGGPNVIKYKSNQLVNFYKENRINLEDLYPSERACLDVLNIKKDSKILDIGCAVGSLGWILKKRFKIQNYIGIDVNKQCIEYGNRQIQKKIIKDLLTSFKLYCLDVEEFRVTQFNNKLFDFIFSFSGLDWNTNCLEQLYLAYEMLSPGGSLVITFRCHPKLGISDIEKSYQVLKFKNLNSQTEFEKAPYNFSSGADLMTILEKLDPRHVYANGYWSKIGENVHTFVESLIFVCAVITKKTNQNTTGMSKISLELDVPDEIKEIFTKSNRYSLI